MPLPGSPASVHEITDGELVHRVLIGNVDAYGTLVRRYQDAYFRFAVRMLGSREDADDALQSAFVRGFRKLSDCRDPERFGAWLYRILVNECRTLGSRRDRRERRLVRDEQELDSLADATDDDAVADTADMVEVQQALELLDPDQREAFLLKYVEELSYEEMAELTGVGVSALKMRVKRACGRMRESLNTLRSTR
jgi:RNA polymerase sigma-70 factor (ECF subfamily)